MAQQTNRKAKLNFPIGLVRRVHPDQVGVGDVDEDIVCLKFSPEMETSLHRNLNGSDATIVKWNLKKDVLDFMADIGTSWAYRIGEPRTFNASVPGFIICIGWVFEGKFSENCPVVKITGIQFTTREKVRKSFGKLIYSFLLKNRRIFFVGAAFAGAGVTMLEYLGILPKDVMVVLHILGGFIGVTPYAITNED